jgi:bifunctional non-homologous end joining protein LigD
VRQAHIFTPDNLLLIRQMAAEGRSSIEIAESIASTPASVRVVCCHHNIKLTRGRTPSNHAIVTSLPASQTPMLRVRNRPVGHIPPCLPSPAKVPPSGPGWLHEIKHDGIRILARRDGAGVRLFTRHGNDFTSRFPLAVEALTALSARSFLLDGEAIVTNERGLAVFDLIRQKRHGDDAVLIAFDLIELEGEDLRRTAIEQRKRKLAKLVRGPHPGIVLNEVFEGDGDILFEHACKLGCEGIVSKRLGSHQKRRQ